MTINRRQLADVQNDERSEDTHTALKRNSGCRHSEEAVLLCTNHHNETANRNTPLPGTARTVAESVNRAIKY